MKTFTLKILSPDPQEYYLVEIRLSRGFEDTMKSVAQKEKKLQDALKTMLGISPKVHLVEPKSIVRSEGKAVRVIDRRKLHD